jgi:hypothetical protein
MFIGWAIDCPQIFSTLPYRPVNTMQSERSINPRMIIPRLGRLGTGAIYSGKPASGVRVKEAKLNMLSIAA